MCLFTKWLQNDQVCNHQIYQIGLTLHCPYQIILFKIYVHIKEKVLKQETGCWTTLTFENYNIYLIEDFKLICSFI